MALLLSSLVLAAEDGRGAGVAAALIALGVLLMAPQRPTVAR